MQEDLADEIIRVANDTWLSTPFLPFSVAVQAVFAAYAVKYSWTRSQCLSVKGFIEDKTPVQP